MIECENISTLSLEGNKERIKKLLSTVKGTCFDVACALRDIVLSAKKEEQPELLHYCCSLIGFTETDESREIDCDETTIDLDSLVMENSELVEVILTKLVKRNEPIRIFYRLLWNQLNNDGLFENESTRKCAFYLVLFNKRALYYQIDRDALYSISEERYQEIKIKYVEEIQRIRFIMLADFSKRTEQASALLNELDIARPDDDASSEKVALYERRLMCVVEAIYSAGLDNLHHFLVPCDE